MPSRSTPSPGSFDGPDQAALARQRDDAAKVLAEKAKERAKQLEGQQPK